MSLGHGFSIGPALTTSPASYYTKFFATMQDIMGASNDLYLRNGIILAQSPTTGLLVTHTNADSTVTPYNKDLYDAMFNVLGGFSIKYAALMKLHTTLTPASPTNTPALNGSGVMQTWKDALTAVFQRYGPGGTFFTDYPSTGFQPITTWELWNEPNNDTGAHPNTRGAMNPSGANSLTGYTTAPNFGSTMNLYQAIKEGCDALRAAATAVGASITISGITMGENSALDWGPLVTYWEANSLTPLFQMLDMVSTHNYYGRPATTDPGTVYSAGSPNFYTGANGQQNMMTLGTYLRPLIDNHGGMLNPDGSSRTVGKPIFLSETGCSGGDSFNYYIDLALHTPRWTSHAVRWLGPSSTGGGGVARQPGDWDEATITGGQIDYIRANNITPGVGAGPSPWNIGIHLLYNLFDVRPPDPTGPQTTAIDYNWFLNKIGPVYQGPSDPVPTGTDPVDRSLWKPEATVLASKYATVTPSTTHHVRRTNTGGILVTT